MDKLSEIQQQIDRLTAEAEAIKEAQRAAVIAQVRDLIRTHALSFRDCGFNAAGEPMEVIKPRKAAKVKYRLGENHWAGRGAEPKWLREYVANGGNREELRVD